MIKLIELFAGIGSQIQALKNIGIEAETVAISEIDKYAIQSYQLLHGKTTNLGDITKINLNDVPDCDLLTYSFPCQDISISGLQKGLNEDSGTRSSLLWECKKIIEYKKPKYLLLENVKNLISTKHKINFELWLQTLEDLGYNNYWKIMNAVDYNAPQNRERLFCVSILKEYDTGFVFPTPKERNIKLKDILEKEANIPSNMYMNDKSFNFRDKKLIKPSDGGLIWVGNLTMAGNDSIKRVYSPEGVCPTLTTMCGGHRQPKIYIENLGVRKLTPKECWRVMGFTEEQYSRVEGKLSNAQLYKQAGNSICVSCLEAIFIQLLKSQGY